MTTIPTRFSLERKTKQIVFKNPTGWELSGILVDTRSRYQVTSVVTDKEGNILAVYCLVEDND